MSVDPNVLTPRVAGLALKEHDALPAGTRFGEFEIIRALGVGGFGIVYLAQDHSLERQVALKEYMPAALASRGSGPMIAVRASSFAETYAMGLRSFINEARLLARFDHPSLVKVYRFWEDNGTAYMVMPYLQGRTLRDARRALAQAPDEAWIRAVLDPMLDALELLHREGVFHRDVAPDNILLPPEGPPILLDFGAARRVISDRNDNLTAIIKPSYAPIEQYAEMATMRQGPWTDLYALGAVLHFLVFGSPPAPATARVVEAEVEPIAGRAVPGISPQFMRVMAWMLGVRPLERPQNVGAVRAALAGRIEPPEAVRHETTRPMVAQAVPSPFDATTFDAAYAPTLVAGRPTPASELPASPETARGLATGAAQLPLGAESGGGGAPMRST
ncbi:MAG: serine/threonine protein kinase, partial [Pseudomonadota bacterium]|nr:serine/threonine protein kinase [Pseudomonadota bacterium]